MVSEAVTPPRVLVVDDDPNVRMLLERVLRGAGYNITVGQDGQEALELAAKLTPFDLLLTDLKMPRIRGEELARRLRQAQPALKVLYLTGYADQLFVSKGSGLWEDEAFLEKPATSQEILEAVAMLLYGHTRPAIVPQSTEQTIPRVAFPLAKVPPNNDV